MADLWRRLRATREWREAQLAAGRIEVVTDRTAADEDSIPPPDGLAPVEGGDPFDDFVHLTGQEPFR